MASVRAEGVAEVLWELKQADRLGTFTEIANRAGFKPGAGGRTMLNCLETVKRDWPHLQWWRAVQDDGLVEADSEHASQLSAQGHVLEPAGKEKKVAIADFPNKIMNWATAATA